MSIHGYIDRKGKSKERSSPWSLNTKRIDAEKYETQNKYSHQQHVIQSSCGAKSNTSKDDGRYTKWDGYKKFKVTKRGGNDHVHNHNMPTTSEIKLLSRICKHHKTYIKFLTEGRHPILVAFHFKHSLVWDKHHEWNHTNSERQ